MRLMSLFEMLQTIRDRDPAARSNIEIMLTYPGLHALGLHRVASWLYRRDLRLPARIVSHASRFLTGIEIHPGATIGKRFFIDHGMGVVIGETAVIGDDVTLYQGVTLGGTGKQARQTPSDARQRRGRRRRGQNSRAMSRIGDGAKIGGGSVVLKDVPANTTAVGVPARARRLRDPASGRDAPAERLPDPQQDTLHRARRSGSKSSKRKFGSSTPAKHRPKRRPLAADASFCRCPGGSMRAEALAVYNTMTSAKEPFDDDRTRRGPHVRLRRDAVLPRARRPRDVRDRRST